MIVITVSLWIGHGDVCVGVSSYTVLLFSYTFNVINVFEINMSLKTVLCIILFLSTNRLIYTAPAHFLSYELGA